MHIKFVHCIITKINIVIAQRVVYIVSGLDIVRDTQLSLKGVFMDRNAVACDVHKQTRKNDRGKYPAILTIRACSNKIFII